MVNMYRSSIILSLVTALLLLNKGCYASTPATPTQIALLNFYESTTFMTLIDTSIYYFESLYFPNNIEVISFLTSSDNDILFLGSNDTSFNFYLYDKSTNNVTVYSEIKNTPQEFKQIKFGKGPLAFDNETMMVYASGFVELSQPYLQLMSWDALNHRFNYKIFDGFNVEIIEESTLAFQNQTFYIHVKIDGEHNIMLYDYKTGVISFYPMNTGFPDFDYIYLFVYQAQLYGISVGEVGKVDMYTIDLDTGSAKKIFSVNVNVKNTTEQVKISINNRGKSYPFVVAGEYVLFIGSKEKHAETMTFLHLPDLTVKKIPMDVSFNILSVWAK